MNQLKILVFLLLIVIPGSLFSQDSEEIDMRDVPPKHQNEYTLWLGGGTQSMNYLFEDAFSIAGGFELSRGRFALDLMISRVSYKSLDSFNTYDFGYYKYIESELKWNIDLLIKYNLLKSWRLSNLNLFTGIGSTLINFSYVRGINLTSSAFLDVDYRTSSWNLINFPLGISYEYRISDHSCLGYMGMATISPKVEKIWVIQTHNFPNGSSGSFGRLMGDPISYGSFLYFKYIF